MRIESHAYLADKSGEIGSRRRLRDFMREQLDFQCISILIARVTEIDILHQTIQQKDARIFAIQPNQLFRITHHHHPRQQQQNRNRITRRTENSNAEREEEIANGKKNKKSFAATLAELLPSQRDLFQTTATPNAPG